uniref:Rhodopsin domain-containing protein n=1 Tax=Bionectria ochroleuca TaxID=29856 RepID=A0A8H7NC53_BIOOC
MTGLQANVFAGIGVCWGLATLALIGRVVARRMTKVRWWYEDYCCLSAFSFASAYNALCLYWCTTWYLGQIIPDTVDETRHEDILFHSRKIAFFCSLTYAYSIGSSKLAILSLYWRLFKFSSIRIPIITLYTIVAVWLVIRTFMIFLRCSPVAAYWDDSIPGGHCNIKDSAFFFGTMLPHFLLDVIILALPVVEVSRLRLRMGQKIAIIALFLVGVVVCVASVNGLILSISADPYTTQMPYDYAITYTWGGVEVNIAVVSSCFPLLRPIFRFMFGSRALNSYDYNTYTANGASNANPTFPRTNGIELSTVGKKRKKGVDMGSSQVGLTDEEKGILGDPTSIKSPDRVHTTITRPDPDTEWFNTNEENGIRVRKDVMIEVHEVKRARSYSSDHTSQA